MPAGSRRSGETGRTTGAAVVTRLTDLWHEPTRLRRVRPGAGPPASCPGRRRRRSFVAPSFAHAFVAAGLLATARLGREAPSWWWRRTRTAAEEVRRELSLYLPDRRVLSPARRGASGTGRRRRCRREWPAGGREALAALGRPAVVVVEATTLMEAALPGARATRSRLTIGEPCDLRPAALGPRRSGLPAGGPGGGGGRLLRARRSGRRLPVHRVRRPVRVEFWGDDVESLRSFSRVLAAIARRRERARPSGGRRGRGRASRVPITDLLRARDAGAVGRPGPGGRAGRGLPGRSRRRLRLDGEGRGHYCSWRDVRDRVARPRAACLDRWIGRRRPRRGCATGSRWCAPPAATCPSRVCPTPSGSSSAWSTTGTAWWWPSSTGPRPSGPATSSNG